MKSHITETRPDLSDILHRIESETTKLGSIEKSLGYLGELTSDINNDQQACPVFFMVANSIKAITQELDIAIRDLMDLVRKPASAAAAE